MKILLAGKKVANANIRSRSSFSFWREFPEFVCKPGSQQLATQFVVAPISSNQLSFSRCVLNRSQFNIYPIVHLSFGIFDYLLFIFEFLIIHYS